MTEALLGLLAALIGTQTLVMKWLMSRSDKALLSRDRQIQELIGSLQAAVVSFQKFEQEEDRIHAAIISALERLAQTLDRVADKLGVNEA